MELNATTEALPSATRPRPAWRRNMIVGLATLALLVSAALAAPLLAPYDPTTQNLEENLAEPSAEHWLGQDKLGRDQWESHHLRRTRVAAGRLNLRRHFAHARCVDRFHGGILWRCNRFLDHARRRRSARIPWNLAGHRHERYARTKPTKRHRRAVGHRLDGLRTPRASGSPRRQDSRTR